MGLLGDIYSASDTLKRKIRGLLADPVGEAQLANTRAIEDFKQADKRRQGMLADPSSITPDQVAEMLNSASAFAPLGMTVKAPRAEAMRIAQQNAAKPVSEGGLGLRHDNTPMERAKAMGLDTPAYRGTSSDEVIAGENIRNGWVSTSDSPKEASSYAISAAMKKNGNIGIDGANVMPVFVKPDSVFSSGIGSNELLVKNPANIRSRFAAFDPARRHEADLLGQVNPELLPWLIGGGLLGSYGVKQAQE